jgi:hypothetical protein
VTALAGGPLSMADLGTRTTKRASHLEFDEMTQLWVVWDADRANDLFESPDYDVALEWERTAFNRRLAEAG